MVKPLFWHQGLFLQPHHFQLNDLYNRSIMEPWYNYMAPHFWGVGSFEIQESSLANYIFAIQAGEFVFPDNSHVIIGENGVIQARSFEKAWEDGGKSFLVYLGLKKWDENGENVTAITDFNDLSPVSNRFVSSTDPEEMADLHGDGPKAEVKRMSFLVKIFWETEIDHLGDFQLIPIARLKRELEEIVICNDFIPPCLAISGSDILSGIVKEIKDQLFSKTRQLEAVKSSKGVHTSEFGSRDMVYMLALRSLNRYVPLLTHLTATSQSHPWAIFGVMRQIVGELSSFSAEISANGELEDGTALLAEYDHKKLWECFSDAQKLITRLLDEITSGPEYIIPLNFDGTYFTAEISPSIFEGRNRFFLVMESEENIDTIIEAMRNIAKLSSRESLPLLIAQSLPGIKLSHLEILPQELPRRAGSTYFQINHHGKQWDQVEGGNNMALYWDTAPDDLKVELMIVRRN
ncbi:MAG: type VI secretion system baseplate subunit TssK [Desulfobacula sp.]|uniref:type VI secretion system baseplate subunit TssK n=1 Tax=Desulfobacula sp. TaxID=2593537 RepID=UPI0025C214B2|nr:type VI secretion system baseplate subunit TssK [Desulfobacula sp.]MCD4721632.1 type VI secretion system baseplate subunit TssK [Desulfobacula sp.]